MFIRVYLCLHLFTYVNPVYSCLPVYSCYLCLALFTRACLPMLTHVCSCLPIFLCLLMFTRVYLCLPLFTRLPRFTTVYSCMFASVYLWLQLVFTYGYTWLPMFIPHYSCFHMFMLVYLWLPMITRVYLCLRCKLVHEEAKQRKPGERTVPRQEERARHLHHNYKKQ